MSRSGEEHTMTSYQSTRRVQRIAVRAALIACVGCGLAQPAAADSDAPAIARVRSTDPSLAALIDRAAARSVRFQGLLASIGRSNGIVYVDAGACSHGVRGCLKMWMVTVGPNRFLRIVIDKQNCTSDEDLMGLMGHELQHAAEALSESGITDGVRLYNFFTRFAPTEGARFETAAALHAGDDVREELLREAGGSAH
jgi:hypothetical protein